MNGVKYVGLNPAGFSEFYVWISTTFLFIVPIWVSNEVNCAQNFRTSKLSLRLKRQVLLFTWDATGPQLIFDSHTDLRGLWTDDCWYRWCSFISDIQFSSLIFPTIPLVCKMTPLQNWTTLETHISLTVWPLHMLQKQATKLFSSTIFLTVSEASSIAVYFRPSEAYLFYCMNVAVRRSSYQAATINFPTLLIAGS